MIKNRFIAFLLSFLLVAALPFTVWGASEYPSPTNLKYVNDYTGTLSNTDKQSIISIGRELEDKTTAQAVVVVIDTTDGVPISDYANKLFRIWGIGAAKKDNGLLLLVSLTDRNWRVEVGRGLEGAIPDVMTSRVMEQIAKPYFQNGSYGEGIRDSYSVFCDLIAKEYGVNLDKTLNVTVPARESKTVSSGRNIILYIFLIIFLCDIFFAKGRILNFFLYAIFFNNINRHGPRGGNGGFGGSGGGGSYGGFGGGSSNGGGSSGSW